MEIMEMVRWLGRRGEAYKKIKGMRTSQPKLFPPPPSFSSSVIIFFYLGVHVVVHVVAVMIRALP
jgi:hypothetical protein